MTKTALALVFATLLSPILHGEDRNFTHKNGNSVSATIIEVGGEKVTLRISSTGQPFQMNIADLTDPDQNFIKEWSTKTKPATEDNGNSRPTAVTLGDFSSLQPGVWPTVIAAGDEGKQYLEAPAEKGYTYQSPNFEFHVPERLSISVVREFARIFEATYQFVNQMPLGLNPKPAGAKLYQTQLYSSRETYFADGGPEGSGGVFTFSYRTSSQNPADFEFTKAIIKIPLPNLGVENTGRRYIIDHSKENKTLIHEIVHQVMMRWLPVMPNWMSEGFSEFVESQDYSKGRYRTTNMAKAVKENLHLPDGDFQMKPLESLMSITSQEWLAELRSSSVMAKRNYDSSNVLLTYFLLLEGNGKGERLIDYLKAVSSGIPEEKAIQETLLAGKTYAELELDLVAKWRKEGLKISF